MTFEERKEKYDKWVEKVCAYLGETAPTLGGEKGTHCATFQSKPILDHQVDVVILGYNPQEDWGFYPEDLDKQRFYEGNPSFYTDNRKKWRVWSRLKAAFDWAEISDLLEDDKFIFFNAVYFGSKDISGFERKVGSKEAIDKCLEFTGEVIQDIFKPKCVICLSVGSCFGKLDQKFHFDSVETIDTAQATKQKVLDYALNKEKGCWKSIISCSETIKKAYWGEIPIYGIPHTSRSISNDDLGAIALYFKSKLK